VGVQSGDEQLARQVKARLVQESTGTHDLMMHQAAKDVQVTSKDGELTLTGTVPSEQTKDLVEVRAREVDGVKRVQNNLMVAAEAERFERGISRGSDLEDVTRDLQDE
jgi:osmotically-inducible protein OsmY